MTGTAAALAPIIEVKGLTKRFGSFEALRGVDFSVGAGQVFGFLGQNGAGKTTTMRILAGLAGASSGEVRVEGLDVVRRPEQVRARVGWMPDFFGVYDHLSAAEYLSFYASCYRMPRARVTQVVANLLELVRLSDKRHASVETLSRGMKQRLCLARALVHDPAVLLLDEPASGLDPRARSEMRELVAELAAMGKTVVVSSHILPELAEMCSTFGILDHGRMLACGPVGDLRAGAGGSQAEARVLGDPQGAADLAATLPEVTSATALTGSVVRIDFKGGEAAAAGVLTGLVGAGVRVVSFSSSKVDLEEVFLRLTGEEEG